MARQLDKEKSMARRLARWASSLFLLLVAGVAGHAAVSGQAGPYTLHLETQPAAPVVGDNQVRVHVVDSAGQPVKGAHVTVTPEMTGMAMAAQPAVAADQGNGLYTSSVTLGMRGQWHLKVAVHGPAGRGEADFPVTVGTASSATGTGLLWPVVGGVVLGLVVLAVVLLRRRRAA